MVFSTPITLTTAVLFVTFYALGAIINSSVAFTTPPFIINSHATMTTTTTTKLNFIQEVDQQSYSSSSGTMINNIALDDSLLYDDDIIDYNSLSFGGDYHDHGSDEESRNPMEMLLLCDNERSFSTYERSIIQ